MIISRTPLRMSFAGGGSDLPAFYRQFGGAVVSTAINQFVYVTVNAKFDHHIRVSYSRTETAASVRRIRHPLVRAALQMLEIPGGVEITSIADIPAKGTGLGSSSSFTVGLLHALHAYSERYASAQQLAREACKIEIERCREPIGKQDQYAAAFGGLNYIEFKPDDTVTVEPIICRQETVQRLQSHLVSFYTGMTRSASGILAGQAKTLASVKKKQAVMQQMVAQARNLKDRLQRNNLSGFGEMLDEGWQLKKSISPGVSTPQINLWYQAARRAGAIGGKLLGAGAGGFLIFYAPPDRHDAIAQALPKLRRVRFGFEPEGSRIIFVHH